MPFDGSGNYTPAAAPNFPAVGGATISSSYYNAVINDLAAGLNLCLTRDGQGKPTAAINWNGQNLTNVAVFGATGAVTLGSTLAVTGNTTLTGNLSVGGSLSLTGALTLSTALGVAQGGTGTSTAMTAGSVLFAGASGVYSQDNSNLFWDNANNYLGIGTASPNAILTVHGSDPRISFTSADPNYAVYRTGTTMVLGSSGNVKLSATSGPVTIETNSVEHLRVDLAGNVGIGTGSPTTKLEVVGTVKASALELTTALPLAQGGVGATTQAGARTTLGLGTMATQAASSVAITGGTLSGVTLSGITDLAVAEGGTGSSTPAGARTNLGAVGLDNVTFGSGTISLALTLSNGDTLLIQGGSGLLASRSSTTISFPTSYSTAPVAVAGGGSSTTSTEGSIRVTGAASTTGISITNGSSDFANYTWFAIGKA